MAFWFSTRLNSRSVNRPYLCSTASEEGKWIQNCKTIKNGRLAWITSHIDESTIVHVLLIFGKYEKHIWEALTHSCCPKHWTRFTFDNTCGMSWKSHSRPKHKSLPMVPSAFGIKGQRWQRSQKSPPNFIGMAWHVYEKWRSKKFRGNSLKSNKKPFNFL